MASMIYGVSKTGTRGTIYDSDDEYDFEKDDKPNTLHSHFVPYGKQNRVMPKGRIASKPKTKAKPNSHFNYAYMYNYPEKNPSLFRTLGRLTPKDPKRCGSLRTR